MTVEELIAVCKDAIDNPDMSMGIIVVTVPWPKNRNIGQNIRALGQMCKILGSNKNGLIVRAKPYKVLSWLNRLSKEANVRSPNP